MNIVFDLDGTICFKGEPVTETILQALEIAQTSCHRVIFASARPIRDMLPVLEKRFHTYTMIGGNGSLIAEQGILKHTSAFTEQQLEAIKQLIGEQHAAYLADGEWDYSFTGPQEHPILQKVDQARMAENIAIDLHPSVVKILILTANNMDSFARELANLDVVVHRHAQENVLDISPENIDKRSALKTLGIHQGDYIAFGNDDNDITMFQDAAHAVMVGEHKALAPFADDAIPLTGNYEKKIIDKIHQLTNDYNTSKV
ncbi:HAD-IIB family hydrolase [Sediminibacillus albus]|uniref:Cof subfamily of IIB subfamily of haloacid dehalogenase superfamily/HAD-superfamily hydrolase, subfamily IIB n=1 Tax=Sediminibacillus albus TaxID=407036 RepID=A0A1G8X704_9BACI|nr:HAD family hydrolase [Sediminibacillus albus]SDJ86313.1 hypothetical protein SAMN05216243_1200 [Sediminibacillus albus]